MWLVTETQTSHELAVVIIGTGTIVEQSLGTIGFNLKCNDFIVKSVLVLPGFLLRSGGRPCLKRRHGGKNSATPLLAKSLRIARYLRLEQTIRSGRCTGTMFQIVAVFISNRGYLWILLLFGFLLVLLADTAFGLLILSFLGGRSLRHFVLKRIQFRSVVVLNIIMKNISCLHGIICKRLFCISGTAAIVLERMILLKRIKNQRGITIRLVVAVGVGRMIVTSHSGSSRSQQGRKGIGCGGFQCLSTSVFGREFVLKDVYVFSFGSTRPSRHAL
mmetsp:Transcript_14998/g.26964  ORF Transcript_14998/g.26964 Transcript_14998/m.26964 type:complete len:274 (-) Transcript_14998:394-1215(-)